MALNPRQVVRDVDVTWDGCVTHVPAGTVADVAAGSALETAYGGSGNLATLSTAQALADSFGTGGAGTS